MPLVDFKLWKKEQIEDFVLKFCSKKKNKKPEVREVVNVSGS